MSTSNKTEARTTKKKPYQKPAVVSERVFETLALSCGRSDPFSCAGASLQS